MYIVEVLHYGCWVMHSAGFDYLQDAQHSAFLHGGRVKELLPEPELEPEAGTLEPEYGYPWEPTDMAEWKF